MLPTINATAVAVPTPDASSGRRTVAIRQFRRPAKTAKKPVAFLTAGIQETGEIAAADKLVITVENDSKVIRLSCNKRIELRVI